VSITAKCKTGERERERVGAPAAGHAAPPHRLITRWVELNLPGVKLQQSARTKD